MCPMNLCKTKKLHYGKYLYKLSFPNKLAGHFRTELQKDGQFGHLRKTLDEIHSGYIPGINEIKLPWSFNSRFHDSIPVDDYFDSIDLYRLLRKTKIQYTIRCEMFRLNIYSNDRDFILKILNKLRQSAKWIEFWEPDLKDLEILKQTENIIISNSPPEYEYKITLGGKRGEPNLAKWIDANPKLAKMGDVAKNSCYHSSYVKGYYFFVRDAKTMLIAQMLAGNNIQRVDRLVYNG